MADHDEIEQYLQKSQFILNLYSSLPSHEPSPWLITRTQAILNEEMSRLQSGFWSQLKNLVLGWNLAPATLVLCLGVSSWLFMQNPSVQVPSTIASGWLPSNSMGLGEESTPSFQDPTPSLGVAIKPVFSGLSSLPSSFPDLKNVVSHETELINPDLPGAFSDEQELRHQFQDRHQALMEADADSLLMRGRRFKAMGRIDLALKDFETIYQFYPNYSYMGDVLMYRSQCYAFQGQIDKAIESLELYGQKFPTKKELIVPLIQQLEQTRTR